MSEPMVKVTRRPTRAGQRVWFACNECAAYGDMSGSVEDTEAHLEYVVGLHHERHRMEPTEATR